MSLWQQKRIIFLGILLSGVLFVLLRVVLATVDNSNTEKNTSQLFIEDSFHL